MHRTFLQPATALSSRPHPRARTFIAGALLAALPACSDSDPASYANETGTTHPTVTATASSGPSTTTSSSAATTHTATTSSTSVASTTSSTTGSSSSTSSASSSTGTSSNVTTGSATTATTTAGAGGATSSGTETSTEGGTVGMPSEGCGTASDPPATLNVANEYIVTFPPSYDGTTPIPLIFGLHGAGRTNTDFRQTDARTQDSELEANYIMAYPKSSGNDWTGQLSTNIGRVEALYDQLLADYCVDTSRVFSTGHSSGAQFTTEFHCQRPGLLRAVAPVAGSEFGNNCDAIPTLLIHGENDSVRGNNGSAHVEKYRSWNGCGSMTMPYEMATCNSAAGGAQVDPGCVEYQDCSARLIWCSHDDPNYNGGTNHGWPCFANDAIFEFFGTFE